MKILVTGSAGFIGYHLSKRLLEAGNQVVGIDSINDYYDVRLKYARLETAGIHRNLVAKGQPVQSDRYPAYRFIQMHLEDRQALQNLFGTENSMPSSIWRHRPAYAIRSKPLCLHRQQHRGIPQPARVRATQSGPAFRLRLLKFGLRRQYENTLSEEDRVDNPVSLYAATKNRTN